MDLEANMTEQLSLAEEILRIWDAIDEGGEVTENDAYQISENAIRLAELVKAAHEFNRKATT
jgi:hypothetical protein